MYFNHNFRSCFCQEKAALWIILSVFLWMLTFNGNRNESNSSEEMCEISQSMKHLWKIKTRRHHKGGCGTHYHADLALSLTSRDARKENLQPLFEIPWWQCWETCFSALFLQHCYRCWSPLGCGRNLTPRNNITFCVTRLWVFLLEFNSLRAKGAVLCSEVCSAPGYSRQRESNHTLIYWYITAPVTTYETVRGFPGIYLISRSAIYWDTCSVQNPIHYY